MSRKERPATVEGLKQALNLVIEIMEDEKLTDQAKMIALLYWQCEALLFIIEKNAR